MQSWKRSGPTASAGTSAAPRSVSRNSAHTPTMTYWITRTPTRQIRHSHRADGPRRYLCPRGFGLSAEPGRPPARRGARQPGVLDHLGQLGPGELAKSAGPHQYRWVAVEVGGCEERRRLVLD